ncbi:MAG TPA: hypothetical protein VJ783_17720 [Pirellulales bacterium]|nr:hypothetical protein [Pirellulales bacterium]
MVLREGWSIVSIAVAGERGRFIVGTVVVWLLYVFTIEVVAHLAARDSAQQLNGNSSFFLHGFIDNIEGAPPLARWDSIWFYGIAREGYTGHGPKSPYTPAFLPLYPALMRLFSDWFGLDEFRAGVWVSRLALLAALLLLPRSLPSGDDPARTSCAAQFALLAFPSAFILVSAYTESLFLALTLATLILARNDRPLAACLAGFLTALTRLHGLALVPALAVLAYEKWRTGRRSPWVAMPVLGPVTAYGALAAYFWHMSGDPLRYLSAKQEFWHTRLAWPWTTIDHAISQVESAYARGDLGAILTCLELPCLYLILYVCVIVGHRRRWPELVYVSGCAALSLFSGSLWGLPRFTLVMFPVFIIIAELRRWPRWWNLYLVIGALLQACLLINYVNFRPPAP